MRRRTFLQSTSAIAVGLLTRQRVFGSAAAEQQLMTVTGPIASSEMGMTLPHEHVLVDFVGAAEVSRDRYDQDVVFDHILPYLKRLVELGCKTFVDCTPAYIGRDPQLLKRLSIASGLQILTNTGYYGAGKGKFLSEFAQSATVDELAEVWIREWEEGIEGTGIRPGFIKIGVNKGPLNEADRRLIRAAGRTHLATGLTIAAHTGNGIPAMQQLTILEEEGVDLSAWIWVHAQNEQDHELHLEAARRGAWIEFDKVRSKPKAIQRDLAIVQLFKDNGLLDRLLLSHDAGWYQVGQEDGGRMRSYEPLITHLIPAMRENGITDGEIEQLTIEQPAKAFTIRVRAA